METGKNNQFGALEAVNVERITITLSLKLSMEK